MKLRTSIFDSKSEARAFKGLASRWSSKLTLWPQLPLAKIIDLEPSDDISESERAFFYKTNVDYTFCSLDGQPRFSVEFDGMSGGYSREWIYFPARETIPDRARPRKMQLKLSWAEQVFFPIVVVSFDEVHAVAEEDAMTVLDGIVGQHLANHARHEKVAALAEEYAFELEELDGDAKSLFIDDHIMAPAEVEAEMENDLLEQRLDELHDEFVALGGGSGWHPHSMWDPEPPDPPMLGDPDYRRRMWTRLQAINQSRRVGCRVDLQSPMGEISATFWMRNVGSELGVLPEILSEKIARFVAYKRGIHQLSGAKARLYREPSGDRA